MMVRTALLHALALVAVGAFPPAALLAGDCGCDRSACNGNCQTTVKHIYHCRHHCRCAPPPSGMVVQSAPAFAAPLVAAPMYAAPLAAAPMQYAAPYAAPAAPSACNGSAAPRGTDELVLALAKLLGTPANGSAAPAAPSVPPDTTLEDRVARLEERMQRLEGIALGLDQRITDQETKLRKLAP